MSGAQHRFVLVVQGEKILVGSNFTLTKKELHEGGSSGIKRSCGIKKMVKRPDGGSYVHDMGSIGRIITAIRYNEQRASVAPRVARSDSDKNHKKG